MLGLASEFGFNRNVSIKSGAAFFNLGTDRYNMAGIPADIQRDHLDRGAPLPLFTQLASKDMSQWRPLSGADLLVLTAL